MLTILLETEVVALAHLCSENSLQMVGEVYGIFESTTFIIIQELCQVVSKCLEPLVFIKPIALKFKQMILKFQVLHHIPYIIRANDTHVLIIVLSIDHTYYRCQK
jgi:hypothetical protein